VAIDDAALAAIARAAEGSARDALSILDQAIAHASGPIGGADVHGMLGLADHAQVIDLFERLMHGDTPGALANLDAQYRSGADPAVVLEEMAAFTHLVTRLKVAPGEANDAAFSEEAITRGRSFAEALSLRLLSRAWQMLLKGIEEVRAAPRPVAAADMVLVRLAHAVELPGPEEAAAVLTGSAPPAASLRTPAPSAAPQPAGPRGEAAVAMPAARAAPQPEPRPQPAPATEMRLADFDALVALAGEKRDLPIKHSLERHVRLDKFQSGRIEMALTPDAPTGFAGELSARLLDWTGRRWVVAITPQSETPTVHELRQADRARMVSDARADPVVAAVLEQFPGAEIVDVRVESSPGLDGPAAEGDIGIEPPDDDDD
jgi:DNA polymerase-3 subunit gamma/tau